MERIGARLFKFVRSMTQLKPGSVFLRIVLPSFFFLASVSERGYTFGDGDAVFSRSDENPSDRSTGHVGLPRIWFRSGGRPISKKSRARKKTWSR